LINNIIKTHTEKNFKSEKTVKVRNARTILVSLIIITTCINNGAAQSASGSGTGTSEILEAIEITSDQNLHFGDIMSHYFYPDVVRINLTGTNRISVLGWAILLPSDDGHPGIVTATGTPGRNFTITLPGDYEVYLSRDLGGGSDMRLENFVSEPNVLGTFDGTGTREITIGAQLVVGANQLEGWYSGTYDITIEYF